MSNDPHPHPHSTDADAQHRIAALIGSIDVPAPAALHAVVGELVSDAQRSRRRYRSPLSMPRVPALAGAGALAAAAVALILVLVLGSSGTAAPTVLQVSELATRTPTQSAPAEDPHNPGHLAVSADGIAYPYWEQRFGWQASGMRTDTMGGRAITTVFYARPARVAQRIGYSIVAGSALPIPSGGQTMQWHGTRFTVLSSSGSMVMTWRHAGHTCILVGSGVGVRSLLALAGWQTS
jgi:hypothetical protein